MSLKKKVVSFLLIISMLMLESISVFAYGSKTADKLSEKDIIVNAKDGSTIQIGGGQIKNLILKQDPAGTKADVVVNSALLANAINQIVVTPNAKINLPEAKQAGSKFKGYTVTLANGKTKVVKKLTSKILSQCKLDENGNLIMTPAFKVQKFKVKIKNAKINGVKIKGESFSKATYDTPVQIASYSSKIQSSIPGYTLMGYTTVKDGTTVQIKPDEVIYWTKDGKTSLTLYPVFKQVSI